jgi:hypothetical protein
MMVHTVMLGHVKFDADGHIVDPVTINAALNVGGTVTATGLDMNGNADFAGQHNPVTGGWHDNKAERQTLVSLSLQGGHWSV